MHVKIENLLKKKFFNEFSIFTFILSLVANDLLKKSKALKYIF